MPRSLKQFKNVSVSGTLYGVPLEETHVFFIIAAHIPQIAAPYNVPPGATRTNYLFHMPLYLIKFLAI